MADLTLETGGKGKEEAGKLGSDGGSGRREAGGRFEARGRMLWAGLWAVYKSSCPQKRQVITISYLTFRINFNNYVRFLTVELSRAFVFPRLVATQSRLAAPPRDAS